jgi:hypothetical protein
MKDIILERIQRGICPICEKPIGIEYKIVKDKKYGKVRICNNHPVKIIGEEND